MLFLISGIFFLPGTITHAGDILDNIPADSKIEIVAPVPGGLMNNEKYIYISGYKIKIRKNTKFQNIGAQTISRFPIEPGQWIKLKAKMKDSRILVATKIRKIQRRSLFISVRFNDAENIILPTGKNRSSTNPLTAFLEDESKGAAFNLYADEHFLFGGKISNTRRNDEGRDLNKNSKKNRLTNQTTLRLDAIWKYSKRGSFLFLEAGSVFKNEKNQRKTDTYFTTDELYRAYTYIILSNNLALQIGRQDFDEAREWIYDAIQDAARLYFSAGNFHLELADSKGPEQSFQDNPDQGIRTRIANFRYKPHNRFFAGSWYVSRKNTHNNYNLNLHGIQLVNNPKTGLQYWLHAAQASGEIGTLKLGGIGIDVGFSYIFHSNRKPYVFAGFAHGSGTNAKTNKGLFRQTGLQDNNDKFGGVTSYRYYGEVMNPELTNINILTFGMGFRATPNLSMDLVFHQYRQDETSPLLVNTRLKATPNGLSNELGHELNFIAGYCFRDLTLELVLGRFTPGAAFTETNPAQLAKLQFEYKF